MVSHFKYCHYMLLIKLDVCMSMLRHSSRVRLFATQWTAAHQAALSMGFSRQEYWSGLAFPSPEDLSKPGIRPVSPTLSGEFFTTEPSG